MTMPKEITLIALTIIILIALTINHINSTNILLTKIALPFVSTVALSLNMCIYIYIYIYIYVHTLDAGGRCLLML